MKYEFGGKTYIQEMLVWGQVRQLASILKGIKFEGQMTVGVVIDILGDTLPSAIAIVLTEEGTSLKDKDFESMAKDFEFSLPIDVAVKVIEDFFICNPTVSLLEKLKGMMEKLQGSLNEVVEKQVPEIEKASISTE